MAKKEELGLITVQHSKEKGIKENKRLTKRKPHNTKQRKPQRRSRRITVFLISHKDDTETTICDYLLQRVSKRNQCRKIVFCWSQKVLNLGCWLKAAQCYKYRY